VEAIGAALCHQRYWASGRASLVRIIVARGDTELLNGVQCDRQDGGKSVTVDLVIDVHTIERDVRSGRCEAPFTAPLRVSTFRLDVGAVSGVGDTGLQAENSGTSAAFERELLELRSLKAIPRKHRSVDQCCLGRHFHGLGNAHLVPH